MCCWSTCLQCCSVAGALSQPPWVGNTGFQHLLPPLKADKAAGDLSRNRRLKQSWLMCMNGCAVLRKRPEMSLRGVCLKSQHSKLFLVVLTKSWGWRTATLLLLVPLCGARREPGAAIFPACEMNAKAGQGVWGRGRALFGAKTPKLWFWLVPHVCCSPGLVEQHEVQSQPQGVA